MKITRSRTFLQVRVGRNAIAEVVLNVRLADLEWINTTRRQQKHDHNDNDNSTAETTTTMTKTVLQEFFHLLQTSILPRIMGNEIGECNYHHGQNKPPLLGPGGIPVSVVAEKNKKKTTSTNSNNNNNKRAAGKNKQGGAIAAATAAATAATAGGGGTKRKRGAGKNKLEPPQIQNGGDEDRTIKIERHVFYAFGESIQVAYRWEEIHEQKNSTVTLVYCEDNNTTEDEEGTSSDGKTKNNNNNNNMRQLEPLSKRILTWCYPFDPNNPSEPDPPGGGFPLPERIPIASLFRDRGGGV
jgi:hypothetical protein